MKSALILAAVLIAAPAHAKPWQCVLWPKSCQAPVPVLIPAPDPPAVAAEPSKAVPPVAVPVPAAKPHPKPALAKSRRIKSKFKKAKTHTAWCSRVPSWATMGMIETAAKAHGVEMTDHYRAQAQACLNSKKG
jgi:hypothetical protein